MAAFEMRSLVFAAFAVLAVDPVLAEGIDPALCRQLPRHQPAPGVAYTPGVDVHGKPVVPADLPGRNTRRLSFEMPVTLDLAKQLGFAVPSNAPGSMQVGKLTIEDGKVLFNGQPLSGRSEAELATVCGKAK